MCGELIEIIRDCKGTQSYEKNKYQRNCRITEKHPILMYEVLTICEHYQNGNRCNYKQNYKININAEENKQW